MRNLMSRRGGIQRGITVNVAFVYKSPTSHHITRRSSVAPVCEYDGTISPMGRG